MKLSKIEILNFKSILNTQNTMMVEDDITVLIGKNESGKSNVLEAIKYMYLGGGSNKDQRETHLNRSLNVSENNIEYVLHFKSKVSNESSILYVSKNNMKWEGEFKQKYDDECYSTILDILESVNKLELSNTQKSEVEPIKKYFLENADLNIKYVNTNIRVLMNIIESKSYEDIISVDQINDYNLLKETLERLEKSLPSIYYSNSTKVLKSSYAISEVKQIISNPLDYPNELLNSVLKIATQGTKPFAEIIDTQNLSVKESSKQKIQENIDKYINKEFKKFYSNEDIELRISINNSMITFMTKSSDGEFLMLNERSSGLKWYLNLYIDLVSQGIDYHNVIYLFDEPGLSIHINAQSELLNLFDNLVSSGNQVIYTTHSPNMLRTSDKGIGMVRPVLKNNKGISLIFNSSHDARLNDYSKQDTLTPLFTALGYSLKNSIDPSFKKLNIVTEGISDYFYLKGFFKSFAKDANLFNIIPAVGATNIINICNILFGWGCDFLAVFDYDNEGVEQGGKMMLKQFSEIEDKKYIYIKEVSEEEIKNKSYKDDSFEIEDLFSKAFENKNFSKDNLNGCGKVLKSKIFFNKILNDEIIYDKETEKNIRNLINRIETKCINH